MKKLLCVAMLLFPLCGCVTSKQYVQKDITVELHFQSEQRAPLNVSLDLGNAIGVEKKQ